MAADSTEMVWGNKKAGADNDMEPVHGSRLCIHDRKDRTRGKPPLSNIDSVYHIPVCPVWCTYIRQKKMPVIIRHLFYTFTSITWPAVGCWDGSIFTVSSAAAWAFCMTVFVNAIFTFCARDAWCIAIDNAGISIASTPPYSFISAACSDYEESRRFLFTAHSKSAAAHTPTV